MTLLLLRFIPLFLLVAPISGIAADMVTLQVAASATHTLRYSDTLNVAAGEIATMTFASSAGSSGSAFAYEIEVVIGGTTTSIPVLSVNSVNYGGPATIVGPATLRMKTGSAQSNAGLYLWVVTRDATSPAIPTNAVVIPEDASGQFQVLLESSTDLVTWTAANPGTYGGSTSKRFFRTRIVRTN